MSSGPVPPTGGDVALRCTDSGARRAYTLPMSPPLGTRARARVAAVCAIGLLGSALSAAGPATSTAAGTEGFLFADVLARGDADSTGEPCESVGGSFFETEPLTADGTSVSVLNSAEVTLTSPTDPSDSADFVVRGKGTGAVKQSAGAVRSFWFLGDVSTTSTSTKGAAGDCDYQALSRAATSFTGQYRRGFLRLTVDSPGGLFYLATMRGPTGDVLLGNNPAGLLTYDVHLDPGEHRVDLQVEAVVRRPEGAGSPTRAVGTVEFVGTYARLGGSLGKATGDGRSTVKLPGARSCSAATLTTKLKRKARRARQVVVQVDGQRPVTVKRPQKGKKVVVRRLPATQAVTARAIITRKNGKVLTTSRDYVACRE